MAVIAGPTRERFFLHSHHIPEEVPEEDRRSVMERTDPLAKTICAVQQDQLALV